MTLEEIKDAIRQLPPAQQLQLMQDIGPELCESVMGRPEAMAKMMPRCQEMMGRHPEMMTRMWEMMAKMRGAGPVQSQA
jgi:hypothetical protein